MINSFARQAAIILGSAVMLWIVPASAADLTVSSCRPDAGGMRSLTAGKKALTAGRPLFVSPARYDRIASTPRDGARNYSDAWYRRQFVLLIGVGY